MDFQIDDDLKYGFVVFRSCQKNCKSIVGIDSRIILRIWHGALLDVPPNLGPLPIVVDHHSRLSLAKISLHRLRNFLPRLFSSNSPLDDSDSSVNIGVVFNLS